MTEALFGDAHFSLELTVSRDYLFIFIDNLNDIFANHTDVAVIFKSDFEKIKKCIIEKNVSQCGQQYLHIH
jgi:hypothetical protein